jgi:hypothetical protein
MSVPPVLLLRDPVTYVRRAMNDLDTLCLINSKQAHCFEIDQANLVKVECDVRTIIFDARFELVDVLPLHFGRSVGSSSLVHQIHFQSLRSFFSWPSTAPAQGKDIVICKLLIRWALQAGSGPPFGICRAFGLESTRTAYSCALLSMFGIE